MSFVREQYIYNYKSDNIVNASLLPNEYLTVNDYKISKFTNVQPWYQPEKKYNYLMLDTNHIKTNKDYRDYLVKHNKEIIDFNENLYKKHIMRS